MFGGEIVLAGDRVLGPRHERRLRLHGRAQHAVRLRRRRRAGRRPYAVEVMGVRYPAVRHTRPLYDPDRKRDPRCDD